MPYDGFKADVWSLGLALCEMVLLEPVSSWYKDDEEEILRMVGERSERVAIFVSRMVFKDADARSSAGELLNDLKC